jgi:hypothetical protein
MRKFTTSVGFVSAIFFVSTIALQAQYQGPATGSIAGGAAVTTGSFTNMPTAPDKPGPVFNKVPVALLPDELNRVAPSAPLGANEFYDTSLRENETSAPRTISGFRAIPDQGTSIPPDPHMAAGPNHLMAVVNSRFGIFDKNGNALKVINADDWYRNVLSNPGPFDPQVVYDHHASRWIMAWIHVTESPARAALLLSVSDDSDPLGTWCNWNLPDNQFGATPNTLFGDYPKLGVDANAVYVTSRMFNIPEPQTFQGSRIRIIPKAQLLGSQCGPVTWTDFWDFRDPNNVNQRLDTLVPAVTFGTPGSEFFINDSPYQTGTFLTLWQLIDPLGAAVLIGNNIPVTASLVPPNANQPGGGTPLIDVGRRTVRNVVYMNASLWTAQSVAGGAGNTFAFARYVRIDVGQSRAVEDVAFGANNFWYYYPAVHPDGNGNLFMVFTRSGLTEYASMRHTGRLQSDPLGLQASTLVKAGEDNYVKTFGTTRNRWGDYLGIALDPVDNTKVWMLGEYAATRLGTGANAPRWGTWFGQATFTPLAGRQIRVEPDSLAFGTLELGQSSSAYFVTVANIGADNLTISAITKSSSSVVLAGMPSLPRTLQPFGDFTFSIQFTPAAAGQLNDTLRITSNDVDNPLSKIPLAGRALGPAILRGAVKDSLSNAPIRASLQFIRSGETNPRATTTTGVDGSYSVTVLEGEYQISLLPEIPYPPASASGVQLPLGGATMNFLLRPAPMVLVIDDTSRTSPGIYGGILNELKYKYSLWNATTQGAVVPANRLQLLAKPRVMIWSTGETRTDAITLAEAAVIVGHLDQGNRVILTGDNIAETAPANDSLLARYFGVKFNDNYSQVLIRGFDDPIGNNLTTGATGSSKDQLQLSAAAKSRVRKTFRYGTALADTVRLAAVRAEEATRQWRAAFFGFSLHNVSATHRKQVLERTINWVRDTTLVVGVKEKSETSLLPTAFRLHQSYPNPLRASVSGHLPFNPVTTLVYELPKKVMVTLKIYNVFGQEVATLVNESKAAGLYRVSFEASRLSAGVYFYKLQAGEFSDTKKLVLVR